MPLLGMDTLRVDIDCCVVDDSVYGADLVRLIRHTERFLSAGEIPDYQPSRSIDELRHTVRACRVPRVKDDFVSILKKASRGRAAQTSRRTRYQYTRHVSPQPYTRTTLHRCRSPKPREYSVSASGGTQPPTHGPVSGTRERPERRSRSRLAAIQRRRLAGRGLRARSGLVDVVERYELDPNPDGDLVCAACPSHGPFRHMPEYRRKLSPPYIWPATPRPNWPSLAARAWST